MLMETKTSGMLPVCSLVSVGGPGPLSLLDSMNSIVGSCVSVHILTAFFVVRMTRKSPFR